MVVVDVVVLLVVVVVVDVVDLGDSSKYSEEHFLSGSKWLHGRSTRTDLRSVLLCAGWLDRLVPLQLVMADSWEDSDGRLPPNALPSKKSLTATAKPFVFNPGAKPFTPGGGGAPPPSVSSPAPASTGIRLAQELATKGES